MWVEGQVLWRHRGIGCRVALAQPGRIRIVHKLFARRPTHTTVVAYLALFVALGGTTYAAAKIGAADIKNDAVRSKHIKNGQVKSQDLDPALTASLTLQCPNGLKRSADICFEQGLRSGDTWETALSTCALVQRRLPNAGELALVFNGQGAPQATQWVAGANYDAHGDISGYELHGEALSENTSRQLHFSRRATTDTSVSYRCVTSATNTP